MKLDQILHISFSNWGEKNPKGSSPGSLPVVGQTEGTADKAATQSQVGVGT